MLNYILAGFGLNPTQYIVEPFGSGLINHTYKVSGNGKQYILQQVNTQVFKAPADIVCNLKQLQDYFNQTHPSYLFVAPLPTLKGDTLMQSPLGNIYRLFPFVEGSHTVDVIGDEKQAFEAAKQFGKFTALLKDFDASRLKYTLPDFHNLNLRYQQFIAACENADSLRQKQASAEIEQAHEFEHIVQVYNQLIADQAIPLRVIHHDTKISNVLFDDEQNGLCVIDPDTIMPGYYLSDVGDMMRTYLSPANEEETDLEQVYIRPEIFSAICHGYLSEMGSILIPAELKNFNFSGQMMIYMQALRFLTDFLNNDSYYGAKYEGHNLKRARNQFKLLSEYAKASSNFEQLVK
ncbi:phosphotransferase enzyme family protein [Mucilaginibacter agri]|uniref:Phosphotransferase n=1 Tax=Mucilaginibacter agri TaxID=2695265 RepID=A0A965ZGF9_9SPHI|nr:aminoglycoside phosphotransferase family protein [Mucilaginibacter agri]NCD70205.1 phosphotransferase [Mucilaginibacter agri]